MGVRVIRALLECLATMERLDPVADVSTAHHLVQHPDIKDFVYIFIKHWFSHKNLSHGLYYLFRKIEFSIIFKFFTIFSNILKAWTGPGSKNVENLRFFSRRWTENR